MAQVNGVGDTVVGWVVGAIILLLRSWVSLVKGVPMRAWAWLWSRPRSFGGKVRLLLAPHVLGAAAILLWGAPGWYLRTHGARQPQEVPWGAQVHRMYDAQDRAAASAHHALASFLSLRDPSAGPPQTRRTNARRATAAPHGIEYRSGREMLGRNLALLFVALYVFPFSCSLIFLGPVWVFVHWRMRLRTPIATVSGRPVTAVRRWDRFPRWRGKADEGRVWFAGESATTHKPVRVGTTERARHTWIVGGTGSGKTESVLLPILRSDILAGRPVFIIDGKAEDKTIATIWQLVSQAGRRADFRYFDLRKPRQSHSYSPLLIGDETAQCDRIMAALIWDNSYYRAQSERVLLDVLRALRATGQPYSLDDLYLALSNLAALRELAALVPELERVELDAIATRWKEYQIETSGLQSQLRVLLRASFGELLASPNPTLDLVNAYRRREIVYLALPPLAYAEKAVAIAKLVIGDLSSLVAMVQAGQDDMGQPLAAQDTAVLIDEFASFAMPSFADLLAKARSARMMIAIAHQSMRGDFERAEPGFAQKIAANTNIKIVLHQEGEEAEYVAGLSGTYATTARTDQTQDVLLGQQRTGLGTVREVDAYQVHPNLIRNLPPGVAVLKIAHPPVLDLVALDRIDTATAAPYEPPPIERPAPNGLALRVRVQEAPANGEAIGTSTRPTPPVAPAPSNRPLFEGA